MSEKPTAPAPTKGPIKNVDEFVPEEGFDGSFFEDSAAAEAGNRKTIASRPQNLQLTAQASESDE